MKTKVIEDTAFGLLDFDSIMEQQEPKKEEKIEKPEPTIELQGLEKETEEEEAVTEKEPPAQKEQEKKTVEVIQPSVYSNLAKKYIEMGTWQDAKVEIDGEEVIISELDSLDEETFLQLQQSQEEAKKEDLRDKYINKDELDDISLQIVEISKNKGDISRVLEIKKKFIDPLEKYDLENELHQEALVRQKYQIKSNGSLSQDEIDVIIEKKKKDLTLDKEASEFATELKGSYTNLLKSEQDRSAKAKQSLQESEKATKKSVRDILAKNYQQNDSATKTLLNFVSANEENNPLIEQVKEITKDPEQLAELIMFLNKKEDYLKVIGDRATTGKEMDVLRKLNFIPRQKEEKSGKQEPKEKEEKLVFKFI